MDVHIQGYGVVSLEQAKRKVKEYLRGALEAVEREAWAEAHWIITGNGVLAATADAVKAAHEKEIVS